MTGDPLHRNRLESLGELAASLAHELNQPLNVIRMACENLNLHLGGSDPVAQEKIDRIISQVDRASRIIESIGIFSRADRKAAERYNVREALKQVEALVGHPLSLEGIRLIIQADEDQPFLEGNPVLMDQLLFNLVNNARDAILERRKTARDEGRPDEIRILVHWAGDSDLAILVEDTGKGIGDLDPEQIFEPFFTTKGESGGTGLGLAVCWKIVHSLNGTIGCEPTSEGGARFSVHLPVPPQRRNETGQVAGIGRG